ncbi:tRNA (cytidine(34)-2'-O)-methyltransferase [Maribacter algicola]|uniref:tRNA (Cytidine(34)-2'-O)-methyltransferase n=1 Tax=Meishania litoralis TaxID=3434685 RepID=A0ACC7LNR1_9FLAO
MGFNIVLIEPEIPNNTGNIGRLALATGSRLHLVKPFGFELNDKHLKRAGLDYWKYLSPSIYENVGDFFSLHADKKMAFFSSHGKKEHWSIEFEEDMFLIFGKESVGLSKDIIGKNTDMLYRIPLYNSRIRSLNLANAVGIVVYEGLRKSIP